MAHQTRTVQVEEEAVEVAADAQRGGDNLHRKDDEGHDDENIEEVVRLFASNG